MHEMKLVKAAELFKLTKEIIEAGGEAWITVTGMSMHPFLREGRDSVALSKASFDTIKRGDIVLIRRNSGAYVLHRVLKKENGNFYIIGDAQQWIEGPLKPEQLEAVVRKIKIKNKVINCTNPLLKLSVGIWMVLIPMRYKILKLLSFVKRLILKFFSLGKPKK